MSHSNQYAVIVAGGKGLRMGADVPKQFLELGGVPILCRTVRTFASALPGVNIILVAPADQLQQVAAIMATHVPEASVSIVTGGDTRYHSVQNGLAAIDGDGVVFVHDGVRPMVTEKLIQRCYQQALDKGSAIPAVPVTDSIRRIDEGDRSTPVDRSVLRVIQTPQTFRTSILLPAFRQDYQPAFTDEATVVEAYGGEVYLIDGEYTNLKITTPGDMAIAEALLKMEGR